MRKSNSEWLQCNKRIATLVEPLLSLKLQL